MIARCRTKYDNRRSGMTLVEVLVAMSLLLVGIWGVARGFPSLLRVVRDEARRTEMTRLAQGLADRLAADPAGLPVLVYGLDASGNPVSPWASPEDPDSYSTTDNPPNARDDLVHVVGERGVIPATAGGHAEVAYAFKLGRANALAAYNNSALGPRVYDSTVLTLLATPQHYSGSPAALSDGTFTIARDGTVRTGEFASAALRQAYLRPTRVEISYAWRDEEGQTHYVERERLTLSSGSNPSAQVQAASLTAAAPKFSSIVEGSAWATALSQFTFLGVGSAVATISRGHVALDSTGALLRFNPADAGCTLVIDYDLDTEDATFQRVVREIWEDRVLSATQATDDADPNYALVTTQLTTPGIEPELTLHLPLLETTDSLGTHVLAVDQVSNTAYWENMLSVDPQPMTVDYKTGRVTLRVPRTALGHNFRFFYRSTDQAMLTLIKPAERFLPATTFSTLTPPPAPIYALDVMGLAPAPVFTALNFLSGTDASGNPVSTAAGMLVSVDYTYGDDPAHPQQVVGELHSIPVSPNTVNSATGFYVTLNNPDVLEVVAVRGASLKVRAWWRSESGRLQKADIDTLIPPVRAAS